MIGPRVGLYHLWSNRPLARFYAVVFIDASVVEIRDGQVANRPVYGAAANPASAKCRVIRYS